MTAHPFLIPAILILVASIPLVLGIVPRNRVYGIRTCKTLSDDSIWYPANRFGGWALIAASLFYLGLSWVLPDDRSRTGDLSVWSVQFIGFLLPLAAGIIATLIYVRKL
ncbi:MAG: SdpI family protein [Nitrospirae bacterium]|nr:MAG: SdpI family protein [Nitrospirota bacterium]